MFIRLVSATLMIFFGRRQLVPLVVSKQMAKTQTSRHLSRTWALFVALLSLLASVSPALATVPQLGTILPVGVQRGTEQEVNFTGARFTDAQEILFYSPGVTVSSLEVVNDTTVKTKLNIAPDCRMGIHAVRVRTATGISNLMTFMVGALPCLPEVEPNSDFAAPQKIPLDTTVNGIIQNEDVDYFLVDAKKGERVSVEVEGIRLGYSLFDPYVSILNMARFELATSDDSALVFQDGVASIMAPEDGTYVVQIRESAYGGNGACHYRAHIGRFPRPTATVPAGGRPGETVQLKLLGDIAGEAVQQLILPNPMPEHFGVFAQDALGISPSPNTFRVSDLGNVIEAEPNDQFPESTPFEAPMALNGVISQDGDVDRFQFVAKKGQAYDVRVLARGIRSPLDPVLYIHRIGGAGVGGNDDSGGPDSYLRFSAPEDDTYVVSINDHLNKGGLDYAYRVELTPIKPNLVMGLPEREQYVDVSLVVPQKNRMAILVSAARQDFGGELAVDIKDLPAGMTFETVNMAANQTFVPVLFTAAADAPVGGRLSDVIGRHVDANLGIEGHLAQTTLMVRGQNNVPFWTHTADRMAAAVAAEAPFTIDVVQPNVPLVRNGSMELKVVATRKEGFTAPIALRMLYNPPGVGSSGSIVIPEGQLEAAIPLTANDGAEVKPWKIAVIGQATVGDGPVLVSSQLATLEIADPFVALTFNSAAVEQGKEVEVVIAVAKNKDFEGPAKIELLGLPHEVTTAVAEITKDTTELVFKVATTANSPAGRHKTLLCRAVIMASGEPIAHTLGTGELRIDQPLPPKPMETAPVAVAAAPPPMPAAEKPPEKRLTRLEQLRLDREKAKAAADAAPQ